MAEIIHFNNNPHKQTQTLLAWYANGSLDPEEHAEVEAHLVECAECRADLKLEHALSAGISSLPPDMEQGWSQLRSRVLGQSQPAPRVTPFRFSRLQPALPTAWVLTAQAASLAVIAGLAWMVLAQPRPVAAYRVLGSAPVAATGNLVVVFKPGTSEQALRAALVGDGARIVDGPTASGAYVLHVAQAQRGAALGHMQADSDILLAEPIDAGGRP
jgi:anti-sigma factor RsiW